MTLGYTTGVFDMFHIGHLNILRRSKSLCDELIVGVSTDKLVRTEKEVSVIIPFEERAEIVKSINYVNKVVEQTSYDKVEAWKRLRFDVMFVGDDWKGTKKWLTLEEEFAMLNVRIEYLPYTRHTSSTKLRKVVENKYRGIL
ncbi:adenylyltransferase/cytidyltransferase family protein [Amylibacter sp.]|nr:adenylyltransferase/cytidyltransferase family protein [Amylibacter sp.]MDB2393908.1 adenylyltransferase/cytidyltransferase family protein [bacterium]MDB2443201.1 adenylyltransferase/cytidyltransferase family protein [Amylibacter sp.]